MKKIKSSKKNRVTKVTKIVGKKIAPTESTTKYYVAYRNNDNLYYFVVTDNKTTFGCWTRDPSKASPLSMTEADAAVEQGKQSNLTDTWIVAPFESMFKNALQDVNDIVWGDKWTGPFDIVALKEEVERLRLQEAEHKKQSRRLGKLRKIFKSVMKEDFLPDEWD